MRNTSSTNKRVCPIGLIALLAAAAATPSLAAPPEGAGLYHEMYRPQFHFTSATNWLNDPNGLVLYKGEYHLFFQHNPSGIDWGNMTWGHAVSPDLLHWRQMDDAIRPDRLGTIFSGSAVVDEDNAAGFQKGSEKTLVSIYTAAGGTSPESKGQPFTQCLAYSTDRGRTWTKYEGNPVLPHIVKENRDPKVVWHAPSRRWIMALYKDGETFGLFASPDLKKWTHLQDITMPGCSECPDFFEIKVEDASPSSQPTPSEPRAQASGPIRTRNASDGPESRDATVGQFAPPPLKQRANQPESAANGPAVETRWILTAANGRYLVGKFDGQRFTPESGPHVADWGANYYAVQTWSNVPDGRRIQIAWMAGGKYPGMPFNQQMSIPCEMRLRMVHDGLRLCRTPVKEVETLRRDRQAWANMGLEPGFNPLAGIKGDLFDIVLEFEPVKAREIRLDIRGEPLRYAPGERKIMCLGKTAELWPDTSGRVRLRVLVDRTSVEVFGNDGRVVMTSWFLPRPNDETLALHAEFGAALIDSLEVYKLASVWENAAPAASQPTK